MFGNKVNDRKTHFKYYLLHKNPDELTSKLSIEHGTIFLSCTLAHANYCSSFGNRVTSFGTKSLTIKPPFWLANGARVFRVLETSTQKKKMAEPHMYALIQWEDMFVNIIRIDHIVKPRIAVQDYHEGQIIQAMYNSKLYSAIISDIHRK